MRHIRNGLALAGATIALVLTAQAAAALSGVYTVGSTTVPGVDTGLVLNGQSVTVTATGTVCITNWGYCTDPDGDPSVDTTQTGFGGFVLPGAPAYGLVGRVGDGPWVQVGSGPTQLSGSGDLVFAVNDDYFRDNSGYFTVTVSGTLSSLDSNGCYPGYGYGDVNHEHSGPPGRTADACWPGWGYGDTNHEHSGPPGQADQPSSEHGNSKR